MNAALSPGARRLVDQAVAQGLPEHVDDPVAIEQLAVLFTASGEANP